jgi:hypothetical protein
VENVKYSEIVKILRFVIFLRKLVQNKLIKDIWDYTAANCPINSSTMESRGTGGEFRRFSKAFTPSEKYDSLLNIL